MSTSHTEAFEILATESIGARLPGHAYESNTIQLETEHFCVAIGEERYPVYLDYGSK